MCLGCTNSLYARIWWGNSSNMGSQKRRSDGVIKQKKIVITLCSTFRVASYAVPHASTERQIHEEGQRCRIVYRGHSDLELL